TGSPNLLKITGPAHTTLAAGLEDTDIQFALNRTVQFTGSATPGAANIATVRAIRIDAPNYSFSNTGAQTITSAATLAVSGPPLAGTNASFTAPGPYSIWSQAGVADFDNLNINMNPAVPSDPPILNLNGTTHANGVASVNQRQVGIRLIMTNSGTNTSNASVGIAYALQNLGSASEAAFFAGDTYNKLGGNAYVLHGQTHDYAADGSGTTAANLYGIVSTVDRKQTVSSSNFVTAFMAQSSTVGGKKADMGYGFWGGGSFDYAIDTVRTASDTTGATPQTINNAIVRGAHGQTVLAGRNQANSADVSLIQFGGGVDGIGQPNSLNFGGSGITGPITFVNSNPATGVVAYFRGSDGQYNELRFDLYAGTQFPVWGFRKANGTFASPSQVLQDQGLFNISAQAFTNGGVFGTTSLVAIQAAAAENQTATAQGGYLGFFTCPRLSTATAERLRIMPEGELLVNGFTGTTVVGTADLASQNAV